MNVVVVESPAKARTINRYLGPDYTVLASFGHVRDLPSKDGSVRPNEDFAMSWEVDAKSAKRLGDIAQALKGADRLILATDPDREGEAISWHVLEDLRRRRALGSAQVERVVFNAITRTAVTEAMKQPRAIDMELVDAYLARRALDYLVGFTLSPVLWRKLPGARSAGRVQSVALRLVVDRELEIEAFRTQEYWSVEADVTALQFPNAGFDLCVTYNGLHCLPDPRAALGELTRVLRPGGTLRGTSCVTGRGPRQDALIALSRRAGVFGNTPRTGEIEKWLTEFGLDVVTLEPSGAVEFFEARLPSRNEAD